MPANGGHDFSEIGKFRGARFIENEVANASRAGLGFVGEGAYCMLDLLVRKMMMLFGQPEGLIGKNNRLQPQLFARRKVGDSRKSGVGEIALDKAGQTMNPVLRPID